MTDHKHNAFDALEKIFHEPNRLAIMSAVCGSSKGLSFGDLRDVCDLTDGNLNRHLKVLEEAKAVRIEKRFVGAKPRTTVRISKAGLKRFNEYLEVLEDVLKTAQSAMPGAIREAATIPVGKAIRA
jgi:DNA-binding transcriptional ArsR family regulator